MDFSFGTCSFEKMTHFSFLKYIYMSYAWGNTIWGLLKYSDCVAVASHSQFQVSGEIYCEIEMFFSIYLESGWVKRVPFWNEMAQLSVQ